MCLLMLFYNPSLMWLVDCINLQNSLLTLQKWSETWHMEFNPCNQVWTPSDYQQTQLHWYCMTCAIHYMAHHAKVTNAKYLRITFDCHLIWKIHMHQLPKPMLLKHFMTFCPTEVKIHCYNTFVQPNWIMENSATAWSLLYHTRHN